MKRPKLSYHWLILAILTLITVSTWTGLSVYYTFARPEPPKFPPTLLMPLESKLKTEIIDDLSSRKSFKKEDLTLPQITPTPEATEGSKIQP